MKVAAIILAAGGSTRFDRAKQLAEYHGESLVRRALAAAHQAGCSPVVVVAGEDAGAIEAHLHGLPHVLIRNQQWRDGIGASIRAGVKHLLADEAQLEALVILACDQPRVDAQTLGCLVDLQRTTGKAIAACAYAGTVGVPALFDRSCFPALLALEGDHGAKALILARPNDLVTFEFPSGAIDIDTSADYERLIVTGV